MAEVKVLVEVIGGQKLIATIDPDATVETTAEVLSGVAERPLVDENGKARNWKLFAPGKRGTIRPQKPGATLTGAHEWATAVTGDEGGFAGPGEHEGEAYLFRVRFFVPKPPPPKKERPKPPPIEDEEALDLTDMETDVIESVRRIPGAEPLPKKKKRKRKKRAPTGEMKALKRKKRATGEIPVSDTGEMRRRKKKKKRASTGEMPAHKPEATEATVRSEPGVATVRSDPPEPKAEPKPEPPAPVDPAAAARAKAEAARAKAEAARAAAAKAKADAERAAEEAAAEAARAAAEAERLAAEQAAAEKAAAEKAAAERAAAEKAAAEKAAAEKAAAEKAAAEKAAADQAAAEKAAADKAAAEKAAAEKAAADKAAAEKAAADKAAAEKAAAEKAAADKAAAEKAAAEKAAADKANTEQVVAISPVTGQAPEPGQKAVTAKTRTLTRDEVKAAKADPAPKPGGPPPKKSGGNGALIGAIVVLLVVAVFFVMQLMNRGSTGDDTPPPAPPPKAPAAATNYSDDLTLPPYGTGEGSAGDAVANAISGYGSLNIAAPADIKDPDVRTKAAAVAKALEAECRSSSRFDACEGWARVSFALYAGCANGGCNGQESGTLIQTSIEATDLALTRGVALSDPGAKKAATKLLAAQAIRLGSQNQKLVAAQAPRVAALGLKSCGAAALASSPDCQALVRSQ